MKKFVAFLLAAALILTLVPFSAFADGENREVTAINFSPAEEYVFYEYSDGEWSEDAEGEPYFWYHINFHEGDVLTVSYSDGIRKEFTVFYDGEISFVADDGETLQRWDDVNTMHTQETEHWYPGGTYEFYVEYAGLSAPVRAKVYENPVKAIEYMPGEPLIRYF